MTAHRAPLLAAAAGAVLVLTACTGTPSPTASTAVPSATASTPAPAPSAAASSSAPASPAPASTAATPAPSGSAAQRYLGFVQQFSPGLAATQPTVLLALGQQVCTDFGRGRNASQVAVALGQDTRAPDLQATDAAVIIGAAVATLCPQYKSKLQQ